MEIAIFLHPFDEKNPAGLGRYILGLTRSLLSEDKENHYTIFVKGGRRPIALPGENWEARFCSGGLFWLDRAVIAGPPADVYIFNTPIMPLFNGLKSSVVIALDFAYLEMPSRSLKGFVREKILFHYHRFSLRRSNRVVAISRAAKKEVIDFFPIAPEKVSVIYPGFTRFSKLVEEPLRLPERFFLSVGVIKRRKNLLAVVRAFDRIRESIPDVKLVVVGKTDGEYYKKIVSYIARKNLADRIVFLGFITDEKMAYVYKKALALVFPSRLEGFGFPALEAMDAGLPVITSNTSSLKELGANESALLVNPESISEIAAAMETIAENSLVRKNLIERGFKQAESFSWRKSAQEFLKLINDL